MTELLEDDGDLTELQEQFAQLRKMTRLSGAIVSAESGDAEALAQLQEPRTITAQFPGERDLAMGGALKYVEDLNELEGVSAEREYVEETEDGHTILLHINGGGHSQEARDDRRTDSDADAATGGGAA